MVKIPTGWSYQKAVNMGMPSISGDRCVICNRYQCEFGYHSRHHITPKGMGGRDEFMTITSESGFKHQLQSPTEYLCGSGTTGCHDGFHGGSKWFQQWVWDDKSIEELWFRGNMLDSGDFTSNSPKLWEFGKYQIFEKRRIAGKPYRRLYLEVINDEVVIPEVDFESVDWIPW